MTEVKPATDSVLIEARNVRVEEWPCDCPTFEEGGAHLYLCPVILIPALLAQAEIRTLRNAGVLQADRAEIATERELRAVVEVSLTNLRRFAESPITPHYDAPMSGDAVVVRDILAAALGREIALTQASEAQHEEIERLKAEVERLKDAAAVVSNTLNDIRGGFHAGVDPSRWVDEVRAYLGTGRAR